MTLLGEVDVIMCNDKHSTQVEFDKLKTTILNSDLVVRHFDGSKPVFLLTDASRLFGLGYALGHIELNVSGKKIFKIVHCGLKALHTPSNDTPLLS